MGLHLQEFYNATLLQNDEFKDAIDLASLISFFTPVVQRVQAPTSAPSLTPTTSFSTYSDGSIDDTTVGVSTAFGLLILGIPQPVIFELSCTS